MKFRSTGVLGAMLLVTVLSACVYAQSDVQYFNYPGGVADFDLPKQSTDLPEVKFGLHDVTVIDHKNYWRILVGIDLDTVPGEYLLYIKSQSEDSTAFSHKLEVVQHDTTFLNETADTQVTALYHDNLSAINFANTVEPELPLNYPATGTWADYFGHINAKADNDKIEARNYIYLTTTELMSVQAPQNAIVSQIIEMPPIKNSGRDDNNKTNYTLFLDHGRGLYSILSGVMDLTVEAGNGVLAGAILGKIYSNNSNNANPQPATLIWQTLLNGAYVNPTVLTQIQ